MGWAGYGKYDGDETATVQMSMIEEVGYELNIPLKNGKLLEESSDWNVGTQKLADIVVKKVFKNWKKIEKSVIKSCYRENESINYMMAADFFMNHNHEFPEGLMTKASVAIAELIVGGHADDFNNVNARKKVLRAFDKKLNNYVGITVSKPDSYELGLKKDINELNSDLNKYIKMKENADFLFSKIKGFNKELVKENGEITIVLNLSNPQKGFIGVDNFSNIMKNDLQKLDVANISEVFKTANSVGVFAKLNGKEVTITANCNNKNRKDFFINPSGKNENSLTRDEVFKSKKLKMK